ncbi:MAG: ATP-binding protein [Granulosicoccus sp.]
MSDIEAGPTISDPQIVDQVRLLLIDDDAIFRALCTRYLKRTPSMNNVVIELAGTASEALAIYRQHDFDCLIVDYHLPDSTGTEILITLGKEYGDETPASIILTAGNGEEAAINAIKADAADFMPKSEVTRTSLDRAITNAIVKSDLKRSLSKQHKELQLAYSTLQKNSEEIKQFYHNVSHEVKTPLTAIREFQQLLHDEICGSLSTEQRSLVNYSLESCNQITLLFNDLLDMTRLESGKLDVQRSIQSPGPLIKQCVTAIEPQAKRAGITVVNRVQKTVEDVYLDKLRYTQILANLLSNALKFTDSGGSITIETYFDDDQFHLSVQDTGRGIDESSSSLIFDRLYQAPLGKDLEASSAGLGLGLAIARDIARKHGGDITVNSELGVGSRFTVSIPQLSPGQLKHAA